ncbi:hypothetical protein GEV33_005438 [Tenebrio molitor]|uniref:Uncharacterized protein n=1 Tax=Tenebrio molitor TaxID=7067 RepID=A0A8J6HPM6_TENMO|nr:hypothetical protein GEV33_005438 [Tenebrio molitor]
MAPGNTRLKVRGKNSSGRNPIARFQSRNHGVTNNKNNRNGTARPNSSRNYSNQRHLNNLNKSTRCSNQNVDNAAFVNNINNGNDTGEAKIIFSGRFTRQHGSVDTHRGESQDEVSRSGGSCKLQREDNSPGRVL